MLIPELLSNALDDLKKAEFKKFKWYLTMNVMDNCEPMTRSSMEEANQQDAVDQMIRSYGEASAVALTAEILQRMSMMDTAQKLTRSYAAKRETSASSSSSSSSSATAPPPVPASVTAQHGGIVVAPNISGSTAGSLNITINKT